MPCVLITTILATDSTKLLSSWLTGAWRLCKFDQRQHGEISGKFLAITCLLCWVNCTKGWRVEFITATELLSVLGVVIGNIQTVNHSHDIKQGAASPRSCIAYAGHSRWRNRVRL